MVHWVLPNNLLDQRWLLLPLLLIGGLNDCTLLVLDTTCRVVLSSKKKKKDKSGEVKELKR